MTLYQLQEALWFLTEVYPTLSEVINELYWCSNLSLSCGECRYLRENSDPMGNATFIYQEVTDICYEDMFGEVAMSI
jgi:hypothetical protein